LVHILRPACVGHSYQLQSYQQPQKEAFPPTGSFSTWQRFNRFCLFSYECSTRTQKILPSILCSCAALHFVAIKLSTNLVAAVNLSLVMRGVGRPLIFSKGHFTFGAQPIWAETHLAGYLGQQMGTCFTNGLTIGPLSVKPFDPF
jgi:hypothetical protein